MPFTMRPALGRDDLSRMYELTRTSVAPPRRMLDYHADDDEGTPEAG